MLTKKQIYLIVSVGTIITIIGSLIPSTILLILGNFIVTYGCWLYSQSKGYNGGLGVFLGLFFNVAGFIILFLLRDKRGSKTNQL